MTGISEISEQWAGLCRKTPVVYNLQTGVDIPLQSFQEGLPGGGGGGSGTISRGIGAALSGMRILNRNRHLLWFTLLAGLVLAGNSICQAVLSYIGWNLHVQLDIIILYVLDFLLEFATLFCLVFLLAGLILSISSEKNGFAAFFEGITGAKKFLKATFFWSLILALAGMLLVRIYIDFTLVWFPHELGFLYTFWPGIFIRTLALFPFNLTLDWNMLTEIPGYGGRSLLLWIYPFGFTEILIPSAINLLLFILTPFVIPLIVLDQKTIRGAVGGSCAMMKKSWVEIVACVVFLGVVVFGVFLTYLLVQAASGMVSPFETVTYHPPGTWVVLGFFYDLALLIVAFVVATIGGIAALDLYSSAKGGKMTVFQPHS